MSARRAFVIKARVDDPRAEAFVFQARKTMYGGKSIAVGDTAYVFASETHGGVGLIARGVVTRSEPVRRLPDVARQTPRVSVEIRRTASPSRALGRTELRRIGREAPDHPGAELDFKFFRQATDKIAGVSPEAATFLDGFF